MLFLFNKVKTFCKFFDIDINEKKTVLVINEFGDNIQLKWNNYTINTIHGDQTYKDLCIETNLKLNFEKQKNKNRGKLAAILKNTKEANLSVKQKIDLINKVVIPTFMYTACIVNYTNNEIKALEQTIVQSINSQLKIRWNSLKERLFLNHDKGG